MCPEAATTTFYFIFPLWHGGLSASLFSVVGAIAAIAAAVIVEKISDTEAAAAMGELRVQFTHNGRGGGGDNGGRRQRRGRRALVGLFNKGSQMWESGIFTLNRLWASVFLQGRSPGFWTSFTTAQLDQTCGVHLVSHLDGRK